MNVREIQNVIAEFARERDWEQFHNAKNLVMALSVECSELTEEFQWLTQDQAEDVMSNPEKAQRVRDEMADIAVYLLRLADKLKVDLEPAIYAKMSKNREKYPVEKCKGLAKKYDQL